VDDPNAAVDPDATYGRYRAGVAGSMAAGQVIAFGVAANLVGLGTQAQKIKDLQSELAALQSAVNIQLKEQTDTAVAISRVIAERAANLDGTLKSLALLPSIPAADPLLSVADGTTMFATPDPAFAMRLGRYAWNIRASPSSRVPEALAKTGLG